MTLDSLVLLAVLATVVVLLVLLLVRRPRVELPAEWLARLHALESTAQATQLAVAKGDGQMEALAQQIGGFTHATQHQLETLRSVVDERLAQAVAESRNGRAELLAAFGGFESRLEQRLAQGQADAAQARRELSEALTVFRTELTTTTGALAAESARSREAMGEGAALFEKRIQERFEALSPVIARPVGGRLAEEHQDDHAHVGILRPDDRGMGDRPHAGRADSSG